eukprot:443364_1
MSTLFYLRVTSHSFAYKRLINYHSIRWRSKRGPALVHNDGTRDFWIGTYRRLPPIIYQIPFIVAFAFIFYVSFDWLAPYIKPNIFEEEERRLKEKLLLRIDQYLDWNEQRQDVICLASGLQMRKMNRKSFSENKPNINDTIVIHYQGQYMDGIEFDNSIEKNRPVSVKVNSLVDGLREGVQYMNEGDIYEFYIHPELGYGYQSLDKLPGEQGVKENSVLVYSVKLLKIINDQNELSISETTQNMTLFTEY